MDGGGYSIGDTLELTAADKQLEVVGLLRGAQFSATPTAYVTEDLYGQIVRATNPNVPFVPINAVAVATDQDPATTVTAINESVEGTKAYTKDDAVSLIPGVASISQTFGILVGLTFIIGIVVIGFFFLILTVQKMKTFTLLRAVGAGTGRLARVVALRPDLVRALVLFDPVAANFPPDIDREALPLVAGARKRRPVFPDAAAALAAYIGRGAFKTWPDETIAAYLKGGLKPDPEGVRLACDPLWEAANFIMGPAGVLEAIDAVRCPIAVFTAGEGSTTGVEALERLRDRRPDARIERVAGTTHFLPMERPDLVRAAIREALSAR
jgi:hypothetical protein